MPTRRCSWPTATSSTRWRAQRPSGSSTGSRRSRLREHSMRRVMIKGLLAHKLRLALTALSVVLGVSFVAGTFVLTDTLGATFDNLFNEVTGNTDAQVRSTEKLHSQNPSDSDRKSIPDTLLQTVKKVDGVDVAAGYVQGYAPIVGKDG